MGEVEITRRIIILGRKRRDADWIAVFWLVALLGAIAGVGMMLP